MGKGRPRNASATSDRRESNKGKESPSEPESENQSFPVEFQYETEDGLKISINPEEVELSREYELSETDLIELSAGIDFSGADVDVKKKGLDLEVSGEVSLPGNLLGVSGGIIIDLGTGEISGGEVGVELGGVGIEVSVEGEDGCRKAIELSIGPVGIAYVRDDCNDEPEPEPEPEPNDEKYPAPPPGTSSTVDFPLMPGKYIVEVKYNYQYYYQGNYYKHDYATLREEDIRNAVGGQLTKEELDAVILQYRDTQGIFISVVTVNPPFQRMSLTLKTEYFNRASFYNSTEKSPSSSEIPTNIGMYYLSPYSNYDFLGNTFSATQTIYQYKAYRPSRPSGDIIYTGTQKISANFPSTFRGIFNLPGGSHSIVNVGLLLPKQPKPIPSSPPPMRNNPKCCQETSEMLADIYEVLAVEEMLTKKLKVPNRLVATNAKGSQQLDNYLEILAFIIRENDHLGVHPFTAILQDSNEAQEGDQTIEETYINGTAAMKRIVELLFENKGDSSNRLNLLVRLAWINVQILNALTVAVRGIQGLISFIGMPVREVIDKVTMPFDVTLGRREKAAKGFGVNIKGKKPTREEILKTLDLNEEDDLEAILPEFLNVSEQPVKSETFNDDNGMSLIDMLRIVLRR